MMENGTPCSTTLRDVLGDVARSIAQRVAQYRRMLKNRSGLPQAIRHGVSVAIKQCRLGKEHADKANVFPGAENR